MNRIESLSQCFIAEVTTKLRDRIHRDHRAPRLAVDGFILQRAASSRRDRALRAGHQPRAIRGEPRRRFDATGNLRTGAIAQDQLAGMSFSQQVSGAFLETTGCLSFYVDATEDAASFKVVVAELPNDTDVESLASVPSAMIKRCVSTRVDSYSSCTAQLRRGR